MSGVPFTFATAVSNIPLLELDVCFATQITLGTTQVGLGNTVASLSGLTNVSTANLIVGGGTPLSAFLQSTWTPTDQSGASLSFTVLRASYLQIGPVFICDATLSYPVTADGNNAKIGGLPGTYANVSGVGGCFVFSVGAAVFAEGVPVANTNTFLILNSAGAPFVNSQLSGLGIRAQFIIFTV